MKTNNYQYHYILFEIKCYIVTFKNVSLYTCAYCINSHKRNINDMTLLLLYLSIEGKQFFWTFFCVDRTIVFVQKHKFLFQVNVICEFKDLFCICDININFYAKNIYYLVWIIAPNSLTWLCKCFSRCLIVIHINQNTAFIGLLNFFF